MVIFNFFVAKYYILTITLRFSGLKNPSFTAVSTGFELMI